MKPALLDTLLALFRCGVKGILLVRPIKGSEFYLDVADLHSLTGVDLPAEGIRLEKTAPFATGCRLVIDLESPYHTQFLAVEQEREAVKCAFEAVRFEAARTKLRALLVEATTVSTFAAQRSAIIACLADLGITCDKDRRD